MDVYHNSVRIPKKLIHEDVQGNQASYRQRHNKVYTGSDFGSPDVERVSSLNRLKHNDLSFRESIHSMFFRDKL